jgi:uncharacterized membrane protein YhaH (DUF805 family)
MFGIGPQEWVVLFLVFVVPGLAFVWAIIDCAQRRFGDPGSKVLWVLVMLFVPVIGPLLYLAAGRGQGRLGS